MTAFSHYEELAAYHVKMDSEKVSIKLLIVNFKHQVDDKFSNMQVYVLSPHDRSSLKKLKLVKTRKSNVSENFYPKLFEDGMSQLIMPPTGNITAKKLREFYTHVFEDVKGFEITLKKI